MAKYNVSGFLNAETFYDVVIEADSKDNAENIFWKGIVDGSIKGRECDEYNDITIRKLEE